MRKGLTSENTVIDAGSHRDFRDYLSNSHFINEKKKCHFEEIQSIKSGYIKSEFSLICFLIKGMFTYYEFHEGKDWVT